jgi:hypothetical protein
MGPIRIVWYLQRYHDIRTSATETRPSPRARAQAFGIVKIINRLTISGRSSQNERGHTIIPNH